jgi:hypothetical protein
VLIIDKQDVYNVYGDHAKVKGIQEYTTKALEKFKDNAKLVQLVTPNVFVLGIGSGRKNIQAEQDCSKQCLLNLGLSLNF